MSGVGWLLVAVGAAVGSVLRYLVDRAVQGCWLRTRPSAESLFPAGILLINVTGSFVLGLLTGIASHGLGPLVLAFAAVGICGGYTTFSTWASETVLLARNGRRTMAVANVGLSVGGGMLAAAAGLGLALL